MLLVALSAIILPLITVVALRLPAKIGMTISALVVAVLAFTIWQMDLLAIGASIAQGVHRAATILLILLGAITLLNTLKNTGALMRIKFGFHAISADMRVQTVLVAFAFICLLEGASGFGTPAIVAAPLLLVLGFKPLAAASLALLGDTVACTFGAVGTPLIVGLENVPEYSEELTWLVGAQVSVFDLVIASLLPLALVSLLVISFNNQSRANKLLAIREVALWSLLIGLTYSISAFFIVRLIGPEFTSIISGSIALIIGTITARHNFLLPSKPWRHHANADISEEATPDEYEHIPLWKAWLPYGVMIILLLLTRTVPAIKSFVTATLDASWNSIFGFEQISSGWNILYSPGTILLACALIASLVVAKSFKPFTDGANEAMRTALGSMLALVPTLVMVQIFSNSGFNASATPAMPIYIGETLATAFGEMWIVAAPVLGMIGAFIAGSATVSTLTMGPVQASIAASAELPLVLVLALQLVGAAAGNTIAIHNVVGATTVVGLSHKEGMVIRKLIVPAIGYVVLAALIGLAILALQPVASIGN